MLTNLLPGARSTCEVPRYVPSTLACTSSTRQISTSPTSILQSIDIAQSLHISTRIPYAILVASLSANIENGSSPSTSWTSINDNGVFVPEPTASEQLPYGYATISFRSRASRLQYLSKSRSLGPAPQGCASSQHCIPTTSKTIILTFSISNPTSANANSA